MEDQSTEQVPDMQEAQNQQSISENTSAPDQSSQQSSDWRVNYIPEEYRSLPEFQKYKSKDEFVKSHVNLTKLVGKDKLPLPKDEKDQAAWDTVYNRLGRPESADKYEIKMELAEGLQVDPQHLDGLKQQAHKLGLSSKQLQGMISYWTELENGAYKQRAEAYRQSEFDTETSLRRELGANFESAKKNVEAFVRQFYPSDVQDQVLDRVKRDPKEFQSLFNASKNFGEDTLKVGKPLGVSPQEAELEYKRILADTKGAYYNPTHPEHEITKKRMFDLLGYMQAGKNG